MSEKDYPSQIAPRFNVRFPDGMRDELAELAAKNRRSVNAEIVARLQDVLERERVQGAAIREDRSHYAAQSDTLALLQSAIERMSETKRKALLDLLREE